MTIADAAITNAAENMKANTRWRMMSLSSWMADARARLLFEGRQIDAVRSRDRGDLQDRSAVLLLVAGDRYLVARIERVLCPAGALQLVGHRQPSRPLRRRAVGVLDVEPDDDVR